MKCCLIRRVAYLKENEITKNVSLAANGDDLTRERLILHYKPYIINTVGQVCKRYITWSDEEASIGLLAFNRAIDTYDIQSRKTFLNYVYLLIQRDLIDYFRREKKVMHVSMEFNTEDDTSFNLYEAQNSMDSYHQTAQENELVEEILELSGVLSQFQITFEELEHFSPKHHDTKENLLEIANHFLQHSELVEEFLRKKRLPVTAFIKKTGYHLKTIERHRKYLVTLLIVKLHPEWTRLSEYIPLGSEENHEIQNV